MITTTLEIKRLSADEYELANETVNRCFVITVQSREEVEVDEFILNPEVENDDAHISYESYDNFNTALAEIFNRCEDYLNNKNAQTP